VQSLNCCTGNKAWAWLFLDALTGDSLPFLARALALMHAKKTLHRGLAGALLTRATGEWQDGCAGAWSLLSAFALASKVRAVLHRGVFLRVPP
jgi:hypothetical protein